MEIRADRKKISAIILSIIIILVFLSVTSQIIKYTYYSGRSRFLLDLVDVDKEQNIPTFFQTLFLTLNAITAYLIGCSGEERARGRTRYWKVISVAMFLAGAEEYIGIHEGLSTPVDRIIHIDGYFHFAWVIPGGLFVFVFALYLIKFFRSIPRKYGLLFFLAAGTYLLGALGIEMLSGKIASAIGENNLTYAILTQIEETFEMAGALIFQTALLGYMQDNIKSFIVKIP